MTELESIFEGIAEQAARIAYRTVPGKIIESLRAKACTLDFSINEKLSKSQIADIEALSPEFRYNFIVTSEKGRRIYCDTSKNMIEIWKGTSEATLEELRRMYW